MPRPSHLRTEPVTASTASATAAITAAVTAICTTRRTVLKAGGTLLLSVFSPLPAAAAQILAVRVWPAADYTRVTLENDKNLKASHFLVQNPDRLVVDI